ncbi:MAG: HAD family hydrolase [Candidatus Woesearchaeota archaeon]
MAPLQNIIAIVYDCDGTLIPDNMQEPMLRSFGINPSEFWAETKAWREGDLREGRYHAPENSYMNLMLKYVKQGKIPPLSNADLKRYGEIIPPFSGLPSYFPFLKDEIREDPLYPSYGIEARHFIISTGLKEMILGSVLNSPDCLDGVYASDFLEEDGVITYLGDCVGHQKKTDGLNSINRYGNFNRINEVNNGVKDEDRVVPWYNMLYVGDSGANRSDHPSWAHLRHQRVKGSNQKGVPIAVYDPSSEAAFNLAQEFYRHRKIMYVASADYSKGSELYALLRKIVRAKADSIVARLDRKGD